MNSHEHQYIFLFGDQTVEVYPAVQRVVSESKTLSPLRSFLRNATDAIQLEVNTLDPAERASFRDFTNVVDLAEHYRNDDDTLGIAHCVLICVARIGELILQAEADPRMLRSSDENVVAIGACAGLLPAAVAAVSETIADVIHVGIEIVVISMRLAAEMSRRSRRIEATPGFWGHTLIGPHPKDIENCLDEFHKYTSVPVHRRAYVGVQGQSWSTIFGPPSTLKDLYEHSRLLSDAPQLQLRAYGAVHAPHLPMPILEPIIGTSSVLSLAIKRNFLILSSSRCVPFEATDLGSLLAQIMPDILQNRLDMQGLIEASISSISKPKADNIRLCVLGVTPHQALVQTALKTGDINAAIIENANLSSNLRSRGGSDRIAIVGMSGRFPGGDSLDNYWKTLLEGRDLHKPIPGDRFDTKIYHDPAGNIVNSTTVPYGCWVDNPGHFDARLFNISPREALQMDPIQRILLMITYEALQMAGYTANGTISTNSKRISTYFGQAADDWRDINHNQGVDMYYIPGIERAFAPGRLNYHFKWEGASYAVDSACASSSTAVGLACDALLNRDCDTAIAGGGNIMCSPDVFAGLSRGGFLSSTGGCKTFSDLADGYCRGEGVGVVVLKRLEDALHDNDNILAVISGHGRNHSALAHSITHPHAETQQRLYNHILQRAQIDASQVGYVEMHGTATAAGDFAEMTSVTGVFGKRRSKQKPLVLGAVKANIGHGEASAGIASLIKSVLILKEGIVPPQPHAPFKLNPRFPDLAKMNVQVAQKAIQLPESARRVFVNNFDASGGNSAFVIEEAPAQQRKPKPDLRTHHVVTVSAKTPKSLQDNKHKLLEHLVANPQINLADFAYSTTARSMHEELKNAYIGQNIQEIAEKMRKDIAAAQNPKETKTASVVFVFTGQGSQYTGMGQALFNTSSTFKDYILSLEQICASHGLPSFVALIRQSDIEVTSFSTVQVQLAIVALELGLAHLCQSWGIQPSCVMGHSLGEYAALCVAGVLSTSDTMFLVGKRASIAQQKCLVGTYSMLAISASKEATEKALSSKNLSSCSIACENAPNSTVVSGPVKEIQKLQSQLEEQDIQCTLLQVPFGFHSSQMDPVLADYEACARGVHFAKPQIPVASTLQGNIVQERGTFGASYLARQAREPVHFVKALQACQDHGLLGHQAAFIELGPNPVCLRLIRQHPAITSSLLLPFIGSREANWSTISNSLAQLYGANVNIDWPIFHKPYVESLTLIPLPKYAFDTKDFWVTYTPEAVARANIYDAPAVDSASNAPKQMWSTSLQHIESDSWSTNGTVSFSTSTSEPNISAAITGHKIAEVAMCPSGVFCDIAYAAGKFIWEKTEPGQPMPAMTLSGLEINHPIIYSSKIPDQSIITTIKQRSAGDSLEVIFSSKESPASSPHDVGSCTIEFADSVRWRSEWEKMAYFVKSRADGLVSSAKSGQGHVLQKTVIYKLFSSLVEYGPQYQGLREAYLSHDFREAVGVVKLVNNDGAGTFVQSPYYIDQVVHLAGFMVNGNPTIPEGISYMATAMGCLQISEDLVTEKSYTSYVIIQDGKSKGLLSGDIYVFDGDRLVTLCAGLKFQSMPRAVLEHILGKSESKVPKSLPKDQTQTSGSATKHEVLSRKEHSSSATNPVANDPEEANLADLLMTAIADETGFSKEEMDSSTRFADIGVDSLMAVAIISGLKKQHGVDLGASFFNEIPTVADLIAFSGGEDTIEDSGELDSLSNTNSDSNSFQMVETHTVTPNSDLEDLNVQPIRERQTMKQVFENKKPKKPIQDYTSNVVLIQGRASAKQTPLFLICDGAGSATAYIHLPILGNGTKIYALESPFLDCPEEYATRVEETAQIYLAALRRTQPQGPYMLGGWSAGAVFSYEVCRLLLEAGETILGLILIDMRVPRPMPDLLEPTRDFIEHVGLTAGINRAEGSPTLYSEKLKRHLLGTIKSLMLYDPLPMHPDRRPNHTDIVWAEQGLAEVANEDALQAFRKLGLQDSVEGNVMEDEGTGIGSWFYSKRKVFGANGWDALLGKVECHTVDADHFSMVVPPKVKFLGGILKKAVTKFTS